MRGGHRGGAARHRGFSFALFVLLAFMGGDGDRACYSGLCLIPTADTIEKGYFSFEFQVDGSVRRLTADTYILNTQLGLTDRLEAGVDFDLSDEAEHRAYFNLKWTVLKGRSGKWAIAAGLQNIDSRFRKQGPYLVATREVGPVRGHLGVMRLEGVNRMIAGVDTAVTERLTLMADYTAGRENFSSAGLDWRINDRLEMLAGVLFPNGGGEGTRYTVHVIICGPLRRH